MHLPRATDRSRPAAGAVGIDLGGTWVRALGVDPQGRRHSRTIRRGPAGQAIAAIVRRSLAALPLGPHRPHSAVVAARGVWTTAERRRARRALRGLAARVEVISDAEAAYRGALGDGPGVLLLAGTGSIAIGRDRGGRWHRAGGLGPLLGDEGSAFWIGRYWIRATARGRTLLRLRRVTTPSDAVARIAAAAPRALRAARRGHGVARAIVRGAQILLADAVREVGRGLRQRGPLRVSWAGSVMADARFRAGVWRELRSAGVRIRPTPPAASPVEAALQMALGRTDAAAPERGRGRRRSR